MRGSGRELQRHREESVRANLQLDLGGRPSSFSTSAREIRRGREGDRARIMPVELLPSLPEGRVQLQIDEFQRSTRSRSPRSTEGEDRPGVEEGRQDLPGGQEWSGSADEYYNGQHDFLMILGDDGTMLKEHYLVGSANEVHLKRLNPEELEKFRDSDEMEWRSILDSGSVKVLDEKESALCRSRFPGTVLSSRMVRRWKPQEGVFAAPKAKSRWCVRGHQGPDVGKLQTYAPTPQTETLMLFFLLVQACDMLLSVADCKNAFCQVSRSAWKGRKGASSWSRARGAGEEGLLG